MTEDEKLEQLDIFKTLERGRRLFHLRNSEGYSDLLDIFEDEAVKWEHRLLDVASGASTELLRDLHAEAKVSRAVFERVQMRLNAEIEHGREAVVDAVNDYKTTNL